MLYPPRPAGRRLHAMTREPMVLMMRESQPGLGIWFSPHANVRGRYTIQADP